MMKPLILFILSIILGALAFDWCVRTNAQDVKKVELQTKIIIFGADWCPPCRAYHKEVDKALNDDKLKARIKSGELQIVHVNIDRIDKRTARMLKNHGIAIKNGDVSHSDRAVTITTKLYIPYTVRLDRLKDGDKSGWNGWSDPISKNGSAKTGSMSAVDFLKYCDKLKESK